MYISSQVGAYASERLPSYHRMDLRVTDAETVDIARMVLVGQVNPQLVAAINVHGDFAVGVIGEAAGLLRATQRDAALGFVGDVSAVNPDILKGLLADTYKGKATFPYDVPVPGGTTDFSQFILGAQNAGTEGMALVLGENEAVQIVKAGQQLSQRPGTLQRAAPGGQEQVDGHGRPRLRRGSRRSRCGADSRSAVL